MRGGGGQQQDCRSSSSTRPTVNPPTVCTDDDVDLEQLVNDMNSSTENVDSTQADTALLLNNGHGHAPHPPHQHHPAHPGPGQANRRHLPTVVASSPSRDRLRHSQPVHIQAVR